MPTVADGLDRLGLDVYHECLLVLLYRGRHRRACTYESEVREHAQLQLGR